MLDSTRYCWHFFVKESTCFYLKVNSKRALRVENCIQQVLKLLRKPFSISFGIRSFITKRTYEYLEFNLTDICAKTIWFCIKQLIYFFWVLMYSGTIIYCLKWVYTLSLKNSFLYFFNKYMQIVFPRDRKWRPPVHRNQWNKKLTKLHQ